MRALNLQEGNSMVSRRKFLGIAIGSGTALALTPALLLALQQQPLLQRAIPSSGDMLPVIGLAFSNHPSCADHTALREVVKTFADNGGRYIDATLGNAENQQFHMDAARALGISDQVFWSTTAYL